LAVNEFGNHRDAIDRFEGFGTPFHRNIRPVAKVIDFDHHGIAERICLADFLSPYFAAVRIMLEIISGDDFTGHIPAQLFRMRPKQVTVVAAGDPRDDSHIRTGWNSFSNKKTFIRKVRAHFRSDER
jgi:hypothetical protein